MNVKLKMMPKTGQNKPKEIKKDRNWARMILF
jgi:hypothetical protein